MNNPLTIVQDGSTNEFPVLKAFQEYIDAEQAKARKRMLGLSIFFITMLFVVVVTFVVILTTVLDRNQSLSDRLLDYALNERNRSTPAAVQPAPVVQTQSQDILKPYLERMEKEQAEMRAALEKQRKADADMAAEKERLRIEEMKRLKAELAAEREKGRLEREKARRLAEKQEEIERQRRRLYPEYYRERTVESSPAPAEAKAVRHPPSRPAPSAAKAPQRKADPLADMKPVTYFNTEDEDEIPFLIETPRQNK